MFYVATHTRDQIVTAEVMKLERRQAAERARRSAMADSARASRRQANTARPSADAAAGRARAGVVARAKAA